MEHAVSIDRSATWARQNIRLEALKARYLPTPNDQQELEDGDLHKIMDCDLYEATKKGDIEKFIDALEKVYESRKLALSQIFEQVTPSGNSLLHVAASFGSDDVMELILIHFPHIMTQKNSSEDTPLHVAVQDKRFDAIKKLIHWQANSEIIYWKNKDGKSPFYLAVEKCKWRYSRDRKEVEWEIFQLLLQESARDEAYAVKIQGMSPILAAIKEENTDLLKEIIDGLPKLLHVRDEDGGTPMHAAASVGDLGAIDLLLEKCPYLALQTDNNGSYPIHIATEDGNFLTIERLLDGTWPDLAEIKNKKGQNILHVVATTPSNGYYFFAYDIIKEYSESDIIEKLGNSRDVDGNTPLHLAAMHNHCEVMHSLTKDKRIDVRLRNNDGLTALDVAMEARSLRTAYPALVGRAILIVAGVPRSIDPNIVSLGASKSSPAQWINDPINTLLLVATLVASVTFTAGLTLPGGYNASADPHPGMATMLHHRMFQVFVIANMVAMYSSILAVVVLLWGLNRDYYVAELAFHSAGPLLLIGLTGMSMAFLAAVTVAVSRLTWLGSLVMSVGVLYLVMVVVVLAALIFPSSKTTMFIVVFYYIVIYRVKRNVEFCAVLFYKIIFVLPVVLITLIFEQ